MPPILLGEELLGRALELESRNELEQRGLTPHPYYGTEYHRCQHGHAAVTHRRTMIPSESSAHGATRRPHVTIGELSDQLSGRVVGDLAQPNPDMTLLLPPGSGGGFVQDGLFELVLAQPVVPDDLIGRLPRVEALHDGLCGNPQTPDQGASESHIGGQ